MHRAFRHLLLASALVAAWGCTSAAPAPGRPAAPSFAEVVEEPPPPDEAPRELAEASFDFRLLRVYPDRYIGTEQICDLTHAGRLHSVATTRRGDYPVPIDQRRLIRCAAQSGSGWADLVFPPESGGLAPYVTANKRIRVRVIASSGGFEDKAVVEFIAELGPAREEADLDQLLAPVPAAFDFRRPSQEAGLVGQTRPCTVRYAGAPAAVTEPRRGYPSGTTLRLDLSCGHASGEAWVDLAMLDDEVATALRIGRGDTIQLRVRRASGGKASHPIVTLAP